MSKFLEAVEKHKIGDLDKALSIYLEIIKTNKDCNAYHNIAVVYIQRKIYWLAEIYSYYALKNGGKEGYFFETFFKILNITNNFNYLNKIKIQYNIKLEEKIQLNHITLNSKKPIQEDKNFIKFKKIIHRLVKDNKYEEAIKLISKSNWNEKIQGKRLKAELYVKSKKFKIAIDEYLSILKIDENNFDALAALGAIFLTANNISLANNFLNKAYKVKPNDFGIVTNLATLYKIKGLYNKALELYLNAIDLEPENVTILASIGSCFGQMEKYEYAEYFFIKSLILEPENFMALTNYASLKYNKGILDEAIELFNKSLNTKKTAETYNNLGLLYSNALDPKSALENYDLAIKTNPAYNAAYTNKLFLFNYINIDPSVLISEYYSYWSNFPSPLFLKLDKNRNNKIYKIGFISGDFNSHPIFNFLFPLIKNIEKKLFEIYIYSNNPKVDHITEKYKNLANHWLDVKPFSDYELANLINKDKIDFLIDLSGHSGSNRLNVFRYKPAVISATWLGFNYSTGLKEIDYFISDIYQVPKESEKYYSEKILRLPSTVCSYFPNLEKLKEITESPFLKNNFITFSSFSRVIRMNEVVISTWSTILHRVPNSKLRINSKGVDGKYLQDILYDKFAFYKIEKERLILEFSDLATGLNSTDIVLDSFPHNSGTTLYESIYMGCPFVTLKSQISLGRLGYSILKNIDTPELVANSIQEYIEIATNLANNHEKLIYYKENLRDKIILSDIMNYKKFSNEFQNALIKKLEN